MSYVRDGLAFAGCGSIVVGCFWFSPGLGFIVAGLLAIATAVGWSYLHHHRQEQER